MAVGVMAAVVARAVVLISRADSGRFEDSPGARGAGPGAGNQPIHAIGRTVTLRTLFADGEEADRSGAPAAAAWAFR